jgi:FixJ family two-component response regulator
MNSTKDIPVIMLTGDAVVDMVQQAIAAGACDYILKPFRIEYLMSRVRDRLPALSN